MSCQLLAPCRCQSRHQQRLTGLQQLSLQLPRQANRLCNHQLPSGLNQLKFPGKRKGKHPLNHNNPLQNPALGHDMGSLS